MMDFLEGFEEFTDRRARRQGLPAVSVQSRGSFGINSPAFEALGKPAHVVLLYNPTTKQVGIRPVADAPAHAYPVRPTGANRATTSSWVISSKSFFDRYEIDYTHTRPYEMTVQNGIGLIDLNSDSPKDIEADDEEAASDAG